MGNGKHLFSQPVQCKQLNIKSRYWFQWFKYSQSAVYYKKQNVSALRGGWYGR